MMKKKTALWKAYKHILSMQLTARLFFCYVFRIRIFFDINQVMARNWRVHFDSILKAFVSVINYLLHNRASFKMMLHFQRQPGYFDMIDKN